MTPYSDDELRRMAVDIESDLVERKESIKSDAPTKGREAVCAFANDLAGHGRPGVLIIGVTDEGVTTGLQVTDELLRTLADMKTDGNIVPPPTLTVAKRRMGEHDVAVVTVWPADSPPVRYKGRIHVRWGPRRGLANAQDERILSEKRRHRDRPFDVQPLSSATIADLDLRRFEDEYLAAAFSPDVIAANDRTVEQRLAATKMVVAAAEPVPTILGILVLSPRARDFLPGAYVQFLRVSGTELAGPIQDAQDIDGTIAEVIVRTEAKLAAHNTVSVDLTTGSREARGARYPMVALQQLVRNALMHRTYEATNSPLRITWYDDRLEILSPGGPFGIVTESNFGAPGISDYRNPSLTEALRVLGFVQRFGVGIATARKALHDNGNPPPEFTVNANWVNVTLRPAP